MEELNKIKNFLTSIKKIYNSAFRLEHGNNKNNTFQTVLTDEFYEFYESFSKNFLK